MIEEQIIESNRCKYLEEFMEDLPDNVMLNKVTTGCGMTSLVLKNDINYVLAVPFVSLIKNKEQWCKEEGIELCSVYSGGADEEAFKEFGGKKIIVTYDSLDKVTKWLEERGDLKEWKLCIDESHKMVDSAAFRLNAIDGVLNSFNKYKSFVFGTATPINDKYQLPLLKHIPKVKIQWDCLEQVNVKYCHYGEKIIDVAAVLALGFINGERKGNAHIFINSVRSIGDIIRKMLKGGFINHCDIRIVCADNSRNQNLIENKTSKAYYISPVGSEVKKVNFYTSTAFEGCDIYDEEGKTFIVTDGNKDCTKIDIVTVLPQIIGRIRNSRYNNTVDLIYTKNKYLCDVSEEDFTEQVLKNISIAKNDVKIYNSLKSDESNIRKALIKYDSPYFIVDGDQLLVNENAWYNEMNNFTTMNNTYYVSKDGTKSTIVDGVKSYNGIEYDYNGIEKVQIKGLNKFRLGKTPSFKDLCLDCIEVLVGEACLLRSAEIVNIKSNHPIIYKAYGVLGGEKMKALKYRKKEIENAMLIVSNDFSNSSKIVRILNLRIGKWYSVSSIKFKLKAIYNDIDLSRTAKATDLKKWFNLKEMSKRIEGKLMTGYVVVGEKVQFD
tara:strand:+ start:1358 stop:3178 length:1821 start_codon:yes stop_codon:yes gene_type:complete